MGRILERLREGLPNCCITYHLGGGGGEKVRLGFLIVSLMQ